MKKKMRAYHKKKQINQKSRRSKIFYILALFLLLFVIAIFMNRTRVRVPFFPNTGGSPYVTTNGTSLMLNGQPFQFTGFNAYNLGTDPGINAGCGAPSSNIDALFSKLRPNSVVRVWAFQGSITTNVKNKQTDWTGLDRVVNTAQKDGIKLDLVLGDQAGTCDDGHWKDTAWYSGGYTKAVNDYGNGLTPIPYLDYVKLVVSRYKDSTAIAFWEPINEPEASDCQGATGSACYGKQTCNEPAAKTALRSFFDAVGGAIKSIDPNHLVSSGVIGGGQCGAQFEDYQYVHASPGIDVATYHDYGSDNTPIPGDQYNGLQKRLNQMKLINKPLIVEEAGMNAMDNSTSCVSLASRSAEMKAKMDAQFAAGIAGFMPWALSEGTSTVCNYDIGTNDPVLALVHDYPVSMGTTVAPSGTMYSATPFPTPTPLATPTPDTQAPTVPLNFTVNSPTQVTLSWGASTDPAGVTRYDIFRNDNYFTSTTGTSITITSLAPSTTYTFFVKGKNAAGYSSVSSNRVTYTTSSSQQ